MWLILTESGQFPWVPITYETFLSLTGKPSIVTPKGKWDLLCARKILSLTGKPSIVTPKGCGVCKWSSLRVPLVLVIHNYKCDLLCARGPCSECPTSLEMRPSLCKKGLSLTGKPSIVTLKGCKRSSLTLYLVFHNYQRGPVTHRETFYCDSSLNVAHLTCVLVKRDTQEIQKSWELWTAVSCHTVVCFIATSYLYNFSSAVVTTTYWIALPSISWALFSVLCTNCEVVRDASVRRRIDGAKWSGKLS